MDNIYDLIVVGAGPAGMMAAGKAASLGLKTLICEKNSKPGRKLAITGKGRCNITNNCDIKTCIENVTSNGSFLYGALNNFSPENTIDFFESAGLQLKTERGNRVFPLSDKAGDVVNTLINFVDNSGAEIKQINVKQLIIKDGCVFGVKDENGNEIYSKNVLVACGGKSYPRTGSTGDGYHLAKQAGHTIISPVPSLVPITSKDDFCSQLQGLTLKNTGLKVIRKRDNKIIYTDFGEMLFTHFGISGPMVLSASAHIDDPNDNKYEISLDLKPALDKEKLDARILRDLTKYINKDIGNSLFELLPKSIIPVVLKKAEISPDEKCNSITKQQRIKLGNVIKDFAINVSGFRPIEEAIITKGGVNTKEITPKTMESKLCKGLYFAGEVIDVDAYTGGFNLQIAFSTGVLAAESIAADIFFE